MMIVVENGDVGLQVGGGVVDGGWPDIIVLMGLVLACSSGFLCYFSEAFIVEMLSELLSCFHAHYCSLLY